MERLHQLHRLTSSSASSFWSPPPRSSGERGVTTRRYRSDPLSSAVPDLNRLRHLASVLCYGFTLFSPRTPRPQCRHLRLPATPRRAGDSGTALTLPCGVDCDEPQRHRREPAQRERPEDRRSVRGSPIGRPGDDGDGLLVCRKEFRCLVACHARCLSCLDRAGAGSRPTIQALARYSPARQVERHTVQFAGTGMTLCPSIGPSAPCGRRACADIGCTIQVVNDSDKPIFVVEASAWPWEWSRQPWR